MNIFSLIFLIFIVAIAFVLIRAMSRCVDNFQPANAPPARLRIRIAETAMIFLASGLLWFVTAYLAARNNSLLDIYRLDPAFVRPYVLICALFGVAIAAVSLLALRRAGVAVVAEVVILFSLNAYTDWFFRFDRMKSARSNPALTEWIIDLGGTHAKGADLWINGVHLGKTPVRISLKDFLARVPAWNEPTGPFAGYGQNSSKWPSSEDVIEIPRYSKDSVWFEKKTRWAALQDPRDIDQPFDSKKPVYYARVRLGEEWGYITYGAHNSGTGHGLYNSVETSIGVMFPERDRRIEALLDQLRLADYRPSAEWIDAFNSYGLDGWEALNKAAATEPRMNEAIDAWADARYGARQAADADSAWRVLDKIRRDADQANEYSTSSVAGRAVELVASKLDSERLANTALQLFREHPYWNFSSANNDRFEFSTYPGYHGVTNASLYLPADGFPILHAIGVQCRGSNPPEIYQRQIVPELIRQRASDERMLRRLESIGGPVIETYILRHDTQQIEPKNFSEHTITAGNNVVNLWFYLATQLRGGTGRDFVKRNKNQILQIADSNKKSYLSVDDLQHFPYDVIFANGWGGEYFPNFKARVDPHPGRLGTLWGYLVRMDAPPEKWVEVLRNERPFYMDMNQALEVGRGLKPERLKAVADALQQALAAKPSIVAGVDQKWQRDEIDRMIERLRMLDPQYEAGAVLMKVRAGERGHIAEWLAQQTPPHPLLNMLVRDSDPALRALALPTLEAQPTPEHRKILNQLLKDSDKDVAAAARAIEQKLDALHRRNPAELADPSRTAPKEKRA